ncbi:MAG TPA: DUF983 domain-containing protein [Rhizomicrobium sp.]|jgi:uncharacterized protein (DUF983 family)
MTEPSFFQSVFFARCPRCGNGSLFRGYLDVAPRCASCGLDFSKFDVGDGATVFVILIAGFVVTGGALIVEVKYSPPYWVHALLWLPAIAIIVLGGLRLMKAFLMIQQYRHQAREGRIAD